LQRTYMLSLKVGF